MTMSFIACSLAISSQIEQIKGLELIPSFKFAFGSCSCEFTNKWSEDVSMQIEVAIIKLKKTKKQKNRSKKMAETLGEEIQFILVSSIIYCMCKDFCNINCKIV